MKPKYLKKISTGECFAYSDWLMARGDMVPWTGPLPFEPQEPPVYKPAITLDGPEIVAPEPAQEPEKAEEPPKWQCEECGFVAKTSSGLRLHMGKHK